MTTQTNRAPDGKAKRDVGQRARCGTAAISRHQIRRTC